MKQQEKENLNNTFKLSDYDLKHNVTKCPQPINTTLPLKCVVFFLE